MQSLVVSMMRGQSEAAPQTRVALQWQISSMREMRQGKVHHWCNVAQEPFNAGL